MTSPRRTLLIEVALADNWGHGYAKLSAAPDWPLAALTLVVKLNDDILGKRGWLARLPAMRAVSEALVDAGATDLAVAAALLATDTGSADACGEIAYTLRRDRDLHVIRDPAVIEICRGWDALADGFVHAEQDPVKAARIAAGKLRSNTAQMVAAAGAPTPMELSGAAVLDDWEIIRIYGSQYKAARGKVTDSPKFQDGEIITTSAIVTKGDGWIRTKNSFYRLGKCGAVNDPTPEELAAAPIIDDWEVLGFIGSAHHAIRGIVTCGAKFMNGSMITTAEILKDGEGWVVTRDSIFRLGKRLAINDPKEPEESIDVDAIVDGPRVVVVSVVGGTQKSTHAREARA